MSLGRCYAGHSLEHKLSMAAKHGMQGIELFYEDLCEISTSQSPSALLVAAHYVRDLCTSLNLDIICLQPFMHYEGLRDRQRHAQRVEEMKLWIKLAKVLNTDIIQVPSSFLSKEDILDDVDLIVADLREIAHLGAQQNPPMRFAYESLCWGTYVDKWEACWDIVQRVDRPNVGICLDTYNILGRIYADPTAPSGKNADAEEVVEESVRRLVQQIGPHKEKIFFLQIVDAERLSSPLVPGHPFYNEDQPARMSWSRNCRLFYGEQDRGAYLPVRQVAEAILKEIGWEGWISMELFNRDMERRDEAVVEELASRAGSSWVKLVRDLQLKVDDVTAPGTPETESSSVDGNERHRYAREAVQVARL
ncbi:xylose isomerase-like protein [Lophiostoma macrostomum CBS 122681]|uniref:Xylose isomerase-like protein n=1 Tax=Lophiostoma macrostomum CBS 122681 TaxID=1314788 RepID=A0A6A6T0G4_9PLEO|nr:xylose isomerase-like protein [Lophiostoma macrostomum CBS 122681]